MTIEKAEPEVGGAAGIPSGTVDEISALRALRARGRARGTVALAGPAFIAAVAYIDPGNFATNLAAGGQYGYSLVWVIVAANVMAMLIQYTSAKVGIATGKDLPEICGDRFRPTVRRGLWVQAELVAMATDLAEFIGAAVGLDLLFGVPPLLAGLITAVAAFAILALEQRGYRRFELAIVGLLCVVLGGFAYDLLAVGTDVQATAAGLVPSFAGNGAVLLAAGIVGATVMPHVVYLHSALTKTRIVCRDDAERRELLRFQRLDVGVGLGLAGLINLAMLLVAVRLFGSSGDTRSDWIGAAHHELGVQVGGGAAIAFAIALLASGLSSSSVGTYAGQVVMQGFIRTRIPLFLRRALTMTPALVVLALGLPTTSVLVISQVVLAFGIPFALVPLLLLTRRVDVMGVFVNSRPMSCALAAIATLIIVLDVYLITAAV